MPRFRTVDFPKLVDWSELEATLLANYVTCTLWTLTTVLQLTEMATWHISLIPFQKQLYLMRRLWKIADVELCTQKSDSKMVFSRDSKATMSIYIYVYVYV